VILGSAGHAIELKIKHDKQNSLKLILIEEDTSCYNHLKQVLCRKIPGISVSICEGPIAENRSNIFLMNLPLNDALTEMAGISKLGNSIFFFDPLRMVKWDIIETVARNRIKSYYQTGTEFIIFLFTSDYFLGRDEFHSFPKHNDESHWTDQEKESVTEADELFGNREWRSKVLCDDEIGKRELDFIDFYQTRLFKWFRYVLPLPFRPKKNQLYHLIICSNYEAGIRETKSHYSKKMFMKKMNQDNSLAYDNFKILHHDLCKNFPGTEKPLEWKILWALVKQEIGIRDLMCSDLRRLEENFNRRQNAMRWLADNHFLIPIDVRCAWGSPHQKYALDWKYCKEKLGIEYPIQLKPISPESSNLNLSDFKSIKADQSTLNLFE
jgi:three-Cys-motif partner protein